MPRPQEGTFFGSRKERGRAVRRLDLEDVASHERSLT